MVEWYVLELELRQTEKAKTRCPRFAAPGRSRFGRFWWGHDERYLPVFCIPAEPGNMPFIPCCDGALFGLWIPPGWWFIIILRNRSMDATRGSPFPISVPGSAPWFAVAAACAAATRFCCDPTCAMLLKNCSNSACDGVRPKRHRLPTMSSTEALRSFGFACGVLFFRTPKFTQRTRARRYGSRTLHARNTQVRSRHLHTRANTAIGCADEARARN